jgi:hypothetical protein
LVAHQCFSQAQCRRPSSRKPRPPDNAVAAAFARAGSPVIGFDIDAVRVRELQAGQHRTVRSRLPTLRATLV